VGENSCQRGKKKKRGFPYKESFQQEKQWREKAAERKFWGKVGGKKSTTPQGDYIYQKKKINQKKSHFGQNLRPLDVVGKAFNAFYV